MESFLASVQRLLRNKNAITIAGIVVILALLYWGYSSQINSAVKPIMVPVAANTIQPRTEITEDMVNVIKVPQISVSKNAIISKNAVVGKYSAVNTVIPAGSMFYKNTVIEQNQLPDSVFVKVKKGEIVYSFDVDMDSTYGNSIMPGNKIDVYMKIGDGTTEKVMLGKLVENLEVLAVKDSSGRDVFENSDENRSPSMLIFGVPEEIYLLLMKASYMGSLGVDLFPVPHGGKVDTNGTTEVSTQQLADYIEAHSVNIPITKKETTDTLKPTVTQDGNVVSIKFPKGCGFDYTCSYTDATGKTLTAKAAKVSKTVTKKVTFTTAGQVTATLTEEDGTAHTTTYDVTVTDTNATNSATTTDQVTG
ncbi:MAG: hypothetical protein IKE75_03070 [Bacilli bacterium]|nr:hypothetical protein [Bacilli bacterium]